MSKDFDTIIIGGGIGGLTAGNYLANEGQKVLLVEKNPFVGGYCTSFTEEGYLFDGAATMASGFGGPGYISKAFEAMGVSYDEEVIPQKTYEKYVINGREFVIPGEFDAYIAMLKKEFPEDAEGLDQYLELIEQIYEEMEKINSWTHPVLTNFQMFPKHYPILFKEKTTYLEEGLKRYFTNPVLVDLFKAQSFRLGLIPETTSLISFAGPWYYTYRLPPVYFKGGLGTLAKILMGGIREKGGQIFFSTECKNIILEDGRVIGVRLKDGKVYYSDFVVSGVDAINTFSEMIGKENFKRSFISKLERMAISLSGFVLCLGLDCDVRELGMTTGDLWFFNQSCFEEGIDIKAKTFGWNQMYISSPSFKDPSAKNQGKDSLMIIKTVPYQDSDYWKKNSESYSQEILDFAEQILPGLKEKIVLKKYHTPIDLEKFTNNTQGAAGGWAPIPSQSGFLRLSRDTPISGLYLAGHWTGPGSGIMSVIISGMKAGQLVLNAVKERS